MGKERKIESQLLTRKEEQVRASSLDSEHRIVVEVLGVAGEDLGDEGLMSLCLDVELCGTSSSASVLRVSSARRAKLT